MNLTEFAPNTDLKPAAGESNFDEVDSKLVDVEFSDQEASYAARRTAGYRKNDSDDTVGAFFKEMARYPLLKPEEEIEL